MYITLLTIHSLVCWLVLISLLFAIYPACEGWFTGRPFLKSAETVRLMTATTAHIQSGLGVCLYFIGPIINYFLQKYKDVVKVGEIRFLEWRIVNDADCHYDYFNRFC
jgi:hypothetical protein